VKYLLKILFVYCFITPLFSQNSVSFAIGSEYYSGQAHYQNASGISITYMHQIDSPGEIGIKFNYNTMTFNVSSPSANTTVNVSASDFYLVYGYTFENMLFVLDLKPVIGAGFKVLNRDAFQIDLGALGEETTPQLSKTYFSSFLGLVLSKSISDKLSFFVEPAYSVYNTTKRHNTFSIKGGIDVTIY